MPDRVSNPGPLTYESGALPIALHGPAYKSFCFYSQKDIPNGRNALNRTDNTPCQKLAAKIKAFQSAFEIKDLAANGTCRQVTLLT